MEGTILDIMRLSTEDGPGVRTTVFFKGCTLACAWCHNVDGIAFEPRLMWAPRRCMGCLLCHSACRRGAVVKTARGIGLDNEKCAGCFECVKACPTGAIERRGRVYGAAALAGELAKDRAYFGEAGGVTLSGGEALAQAAFAEELLGELKARGIHTAVDTCGMVGWEAFERTLPYTDLVLFDLKLIDGGRHREWTGAVNGLILDNAGKLGTVLGRNVEVWVRTPVVPGATDDAKNIRAIGAFIRGNMKTVTKWELLSFNNLCRAKYEAMGLEWRFATAQAETKEKMQYLCGVASEAWGREAVWSGATRPE